MHKKVFWEPLPYSQAGGFHLCLELPQYSSRDVARQVYRKLKTLMYLALMKNLRLLD